MSSFILHFLAHTRITIATDHKFYIYIIFKNFYIIFIIKNKIVFIYLVIVMYDFYNYSLFSENIFVSCR